MDTAILWDLGTGGRSKAMSGHRGHVTSLAWADANVFLTGACLCCCMYVYVYILYT